MKRQHTSYPIVAIFLLPSLIGFCLFILVPMLSTIGLSITNYSGGKSFSFIWFKNYLEAYNSKTFWSSLWVTLKFVSGSVVLQLLIGLFFALILNDNFKGRNFFRSVYFLPSVLSTVAVSLSFMLLLNPIKGPVNQFLISLGLAPSPWLAGKDTALGTIIFVTVWQSFGYYMVIFISGLQGINNALYESADIDGTTRFQKLLYITLPMLTPTVFFCVTMAIIRGFQVFDQVFILTGGQAGGGPAGATNVLVFEIYKNAFTRYKLGFSSAEATVLLVIVLIITLFQYQGQKKWVSYDL